MAASANGTTVRFPAEEFCATYQPVFELRGEAYRLYGAYCRVTGPETTSAQSVAALRRLSRRTETATNPAVDRVRVATALREWAPLAAAFATRSHKYLYFRLPATTLASDQAFVPFLEYQAGKNALALDQLVVEVVGFAPGSMDQRFYRALLDLRDLGVRFAMDGVRLDRPETDRIPGRREVHDCDPHFLKINSDLVFNCSRFRNQQSLLEAIATLSCILGARMVADGVERVNDLHLLKKLGVDLVSGSLFAPAMSATQLELSGWLGFEERLLPIADESVFSRIS